MSSLREGIPAAPGIVIGPARVLRWEVPRVPHGATVPAEQADAEIARFREALAYASERIKALQVRTAAAIGEVEARIFEPQVLMLEDADLIDGTIRTIRENLLTAERAFEWRVLEWESALSHSSHPMVLDRLADLADVQTRVLRRLMGMPDPDLAARVGDGEKFILVARELTPSVTVQLDPRTVMGIATDLGTRTSHSAILARSLEIPCVVSVGNLSEEVRDGDELILDGRTGRVVVGASEEDREAYRQRDYLIREWEQELVLLAHLPAVTRDGVRMALRANIDLPGESDNARIHGAEGVGLYRTEFLVVGRATAPNEEEQFRAYKRVTESFPGQPVVIRTFDLGGDKFPAFLHIGREENPFLGWRAIRVCLDEPAIFRTQLRALIRAMPFGDLRIMLPLVNEISEVTRTRALINEAIEELRAEGQPVPDAYKLGAMVETPAAAMLAPELARHVDFFSIGTNDLVQYTLAVDRGNSRLASRYNPFHPAVVRLLAAICKAGNEAGIEVSVCGEVAATPLGAFLLIGMRASSLSVGPPALAEIKKVIRSVTYDDAAAGVAEAMAAHSPEEVVSVLTARLARVLDLGKFSASLGLSRAD
ncbi:MAG TPA: phosphoenolpyruvate--protein phosphotransferase [Longimicrobium sp.]|uniref:phosphoenolpyruvate--protein phosphotransferase n=1 Tax=Longimicrobium sp. TaxID=2029185 RepID=UPI002EDAB091